VEQIIKIWHRFIKKTDGNIYSASTNLVSQFPSVAQYKCCYLTRNRVNLLEGWKDKNSSFPHPRFSLTDDIHSKNGLRDALVLHWCGTKRNWSSTPVSKSSGSVLMESVTMFCSKEESVPAHQQDKNVTNYTVKTNDKHWSPAEHPTSVTAMC